jgi:hypothetical protein
MTDGGGRRGVYEVEKEGQCLFLAMWRFDD